MLDLAAAIRALIGYFEQVGILIVHLLDHFPGRFFLLFVLFALQEPLHRLGDRIRP